MSDTPGTNALRDELTNAVRSAESWASYYATTDPAQAASNALNTLAADLSTIAAWADESGIAPQLLDSLLARLTPEAREAALIDGGWVARHHPDECPRSYGPMDPCRCGSRPLYRFTMKGANDG